MTGNFETRLKRLEGRLTRSPPLYEGSVIVYEGASPEETEQRIAEACVAAGISPERAIVLLVVTPETKNPLRTDARA